MVSSKQLSNEIKSISKLSKRTRQAAAQETPTTSGTNDDQEDLVITIKKIVKEEFDKHEKKIDEMIKLHLQSTNEHLDKISIVIEVTKSLGFTQSTLNEELSTVKNDIKKLASDMKELEKNLLNPNKVLEKLIELEDRSQRNNLHIDDLTENTNETLNNCEKKIQEVL